MTETYNTLSSLRVGSAGERCRRGLSRLLLLAPASSSVLADGSVDTVPSASEEQDAGPSLRSKHAPCERKANKFRWRLSCLVNCSYGGRLYTLLCWDSASSVTIMSFDVLSPSCSPVIESAKREREGVGVKRERERVCEREREENEKQILLPVSNHYHHHHPLPPPPYTQTHTTPQSPPRSLVWVN